MHYEAKNSVSALASSARKATQVPVTPQGRTSRLFNTQYSTLSGRFALTAPEPRAEGGHSFLQEA
jgi:hypothetical protein